MFGCRTALALPERPSILVRECSRRFLHATAEANYASLPVVTQARSNIPDTLGEGGSLLESDDPLDFAMACHFLNTEPGLRDKMIAAGLRNLQRYERENLRRELEEWLAQFDFLQPVKE